MERYIKNFKKFAQSTGIALDDWQIQELVAFSNEIGYNYDRRNTLLQFVKLKYKNWTKVWQSLTSMHNSTLKYQKILYGKIDGITRYNAINIKKRQGFSNTVEYHTARGKTIDEALIEIRKIQKSRNKRAITSIMKKPSIARSCRQIGWWIDKGYTAEQAALEVKRVQTTNGYAYYSSTTSQHDRNARWQASLNANPANNNIGYKRSHSLNRYIERAGGDINAGYTAYCSYRRNLSGWHTASKTSMKIFRPIIDLCNVAGIDCYYGADGRHEWILRHKNKAFMYDLTIPLLGIIIEFNGETWHPNPAWDGDKWHTWKHPHTKETADDRFLKDDIKMQAAITAGWTLYVIWESHTDITQLIEQIRSQVSQQTL